MKGIVSFYEKPGCVGNAKQKKLLMDAGYKLQVVDMISKEWQEQDLRAFFNDTPIHACINKTAPQITSGQFKPEDHSPDELLAAMIASPILIKRPLLFFRGKFACGFNNKLVEELLGTPQEDTKCAKTDNCPH